MPNQDQSVHPDTVRDIHDVASHFSHAKPEGGGYRLRCTVHDDRHASVMLNVGRNGNLVLHCHAGCATSDILAAVGLTMADLRGEAHATITPLRTGVVARYDYVDSLGEVVRTKVKAVKADGRKTFWWEPPGSNDLLYRLPQLREAIEAGATIHITEGEKDADTLIAAGFVATTGGGAGTWLPEFTGQLRGAKEIVVVADDDEPGHKHATKVAQALTKAGHDVRVALPMKGHKDVTEVAEAGHAPLDGLRWLGGEPEGMVTVMSSVALSPARWAWRRHFATGAISYIEGDPGASKSTVTCDLAARWSTGRDMPDGSPNPFGGAVTVAMLTAEDSLEHTMGPRLYAAGADMSKVVTINCGPDGSPFSLGGDDHFDALRAALKARKVRVLVIDPLPAFLSDKTDSFKDASVRVAMLPVSMLAMELDMAVIVVRHFNKGTGGKAIHKGGGSIGFAGAARAVFQVSKHPDEDGQCIWTNAKNNLARAQVSLTYQLVQDHRVRELDSEFEIARIEWLGTSELDAQQVLDAVPDDTAQDYYDVMLRVAADGVPKAWDTYKEVLAKAGLSIRAAEDKHRKKVLRKVFDSTGNAGCKWVAINAPAKPEPKPPRKAKPKPAKTPAPSPESVCESCGRGPAVYFAAPVSEFRCMAHAPAVR
jgi:hypothetical protein